MGYSPTVSIQSFIALVLLKLYTVFSLISLQSFFIFESLLHVLYLFLDLQSGRLFEVGAYSRLSAY